MFFLGLGIGLVIGAILSGFIMRNNYKKSLVVLSEAEARAEEFKKKVAKEVEEVVKEVSERVKKRLEK
jgi:cytidylate kinase